MKFVSLILCVLLLQTLIAGCKSHTAASQKSVTEASSDSEYPQWIDMMNDSTVNYYKAVEAFNKYWEHREKPTEDDGEGRDIFDSEKDKESREKSIEFVYEYKQFLNWQLKNKDFVKPDGSIMTAEEIKEQSEKELKNR